MRCPKLLEEIFSSTLEIFFQEDQGPGKGGFDHWEEENPTGQEIRGEGGLDCSSTRRLFCSWEKLPSGIVDHAKILAGDIHIDRRGFREGVTETDETGPPHHGDLGNTGPRDEVFRPLDFHSSQSNILPDLQRGTCRGEVEELLRGVCFIETKGKEDDIGSAGRKTKFILAGRPHTRVGGPIRIVGKFDEGFPGGLEGALDFDTGVNRQIFGFNGLID